MTNFNYIAGGIGILSLAVLINYLIGVIKYPEYSVIEYKKSFKEKLYLCIVTLGWAMLIYKGLQGIFGFVLGDAVYSEEWGSVFILGVLFSLPLLQHLTDTAIKINEYKRLNILFNELNKYIHSPYEVPDIAIEAAKSKANDTYLKDRKIFEELTELLISIKKRDSKMLEMLKN